ncbi:MAG: helix-turn-helix domain-containing protein [Elusimicrobia bacterium]|nr:helix-turn-helix domain-containing protein [Elusimicrobiota bacterium]
MAETLRAESTAGFVRTLRGALRVTQRELAQRTFTDRALIARLEAGREPRLPTLRRLVASLGGRLELAARFERPLEALAESFVEPRLAFRAERDAGRRERHWKRRLGLQARR